MSPSVQLLLLVACLAPFSSAVPVDSQAELKKVKAALEELRADRQGELSMRPHLAQLLMFCSRALSIQVGAGDGQPLELRAENIQINQI